MTACVNEGKERGRDERRRKGRKEERESESERRGTIKLTARSKWC